jgi:hypothetical protein
MIQEMLKALLQKRISVNISAFTGEILFRPAENSWHCRYNWRYCGKFSKGCGFIAYVLLSMAVSGIFHFAIGFDTHRV